MKRLHRAWAVCLGCTLMLFVSGGLAVNTFSVTQPYILAYGGFTNTQTSMITTLRAVSYLACMLAAPAFFRRLGYRAGTALAVAFCGVSFVMFGISENLAGFYAAGILAGLGYGFGSMIPATILMNRWFRRKTGFAVGLCSASTGLAMIVFSPVLTAICETAGLKTCFFVEAAFSFVSAALVFLLIRDAPEKMDLLPYGAEPGAAFAAKMTAGESGERSGEIAAKRSGKRAATCSGERPEGLPRGALAAPWLASGLLGAVASPGPTHLMILYTTAGVAAHQAALAVSVFGVALMAGKCVYGAACDRFGGYRMGWLFGAILCAGLALCALADAGGAALMFGAVTLYGLGVPLSTVGLAIWAADFGGEAQVGRLVRQLQLSYAVGSLLLSAMPGMIADRTGSYAPAYLVLLGCAAVSILAVQRIYRARR